MNYSERREIHMILSDIISNKDSISTLFPLIGEGGYAKVFLIN